MGKRKFFGLLLMIVAILSMVTMSCKKSTEEADEEADTYEITIVNNSSSTFAVYIDDVYEGDLKKKQYGKYEVSVDGVHTARVLQKNGYILYPTEKTTTFVYGGADMWTFSN